MTLNPRGSLVRSALAILAGVATLTAASFAIEALTDWGLMSGFPESFPSVQAINHNRAARFFMYSYGGLSVAAGGFVTAWLSKRAPLVHAALLGIVQALLTIWAAIAMPEHASAWTWIVTVLMSPPAATLGGWLYWRRSGGNLGAANL